MSNNHPNRSRLKNETSIVSYKGFDANLSCLGYKFEVGGSYEHVGKVVACPTTEQVARGEGGFHACSIEQHPLSVFEFYPPASSRYARVVQSGAMDVKETKTCSARISVEVEISLTDLIKDAVKWVCDRAKWADGPIATEQGEAATASGTRGVATASGDQGAATASGYQGAATASGYQGAATASGNQGAATASGYQGAATASGNQGAARGVKDGSAIFLVYRDLYNGEIKYAWAGITGRAGIKAGVFYRLDADGVPQEVAP